MPQDMYTAGPPAGVLRKAADAERQARLDEEIARVAADPEMPDWRKTMISNQLRHKKARIKLEAASQGMREMGQGAG